MTCARLTKLQKTMLAGKSNNGIFIYHCLRWCNRIKREYWFTLNLHCVMGEKTGNDGDQFDSRNLPTKYLPENTNDYEKTSGPINWIIKAIDDGFDLTTIINKNRRELDEFLDIETSAEEEAYF